MSTVNYRILFEIIVLHDYYLSQADEQSFFDLADVDRQDFLLRQLELEHYNVSKDLQIEPTSKTEKFFKNHRMRLVLTSTGFFVGAEIELVLNAANEEVYELAIPIAQSVTWEFTISIKNLEYRNFSNMRFKNSLPLNYLFTNENPGDIKNFPSLAFPVADFKAGVTYEMGELAMIDSKLNQAVEQTSDSTVGWEELASNHHWANEQDRILLPKLTSYNIRSTGISEIEFELQTPEGSAVLTFNTSDENTRKTTAPNGNLTSVILDFRNPENHDPAVESIASGRYNLQVSENGGAPIILPVFISDDLYMGNGLGGIVIHSRGAGSGSDILSADNKLIRVEGNHPLFEIRFKNRNCYWRYKSHSKKGLKAENEALNFLEEVDDDLRTKKPKSLQRLPVQFENGGGKIFLPNPGKPQVKPEKDGRLYTDVFVSEVEGLIGTK